MTNNHLRGEWSYLKKLYGDNVFEENFFFIKDVYFQKWRSQIKKGYVINFLVSIESPPVNLLKNWYKDDICSLILSFDGDFGLGHFTLKNRKLLKLKGKKVRFDINMQSEEAYQEIKVILPDSEILFRAAVLNIMGISASRSLHET